MAAGFEERTAMTAIRILTAAFIAGSMLSGCADARPHVAAVSGGNVAVGSFDSIELRGGGHVTLHYGPAQAVTLVSGSTEFTRFAIEDGHKLVIDACNDNCPHDYHLEIEIASPHISAVAIEGGGRIAAAPGFPAQDRITAAVEGGGDIDLTTLNSHDATAAVDGGGKIRIHADGRLTAAVNGGGAIRYTGNAQVTSAIDGGGSVQADGG